MQKTRENKYEIPGFLLNVLGGRGERSVKKAGKHGYLHSGWMMQKAIEYREGR